VRVLLDTCALAELRHPRGNLAVKAAIALIPDDNLYLSGLSFGEIARGIALLRDGRQKRNLTVWLTGLENQFADHILPVDHETARIWGDVTVRVEHAGLAIGAFEGLLAATALHHGLHFMTHSTPGLAATGTLIVDPWAEVGADG
jgi:predicted nucleic acid-binding protein